jgi:hypothetical protein
MFTICAAVGNYLWEKQFFIERNQRTFFLENALMNNFLGSHYFVALLKALVSPNTPFSVTAKSGAGRASQRGVSAFLFLSCVFVAVDVSGLVAASVLRPGGGLHEATLCTNVLLYPLLLAAGGNVVVLLFSPRLQRQEVRLDRSRLRAFASTSGVRTKGVREREREPIAVEPTRRFSHA